MSSSPVIDVHTHCLTEAWFSLLKQHGAPRYSVEAVRGGLRAIHLDGAPFMTPVPAMFDYALRLKTMNDCGVDVCIVSLTCPNCYWGGPQVSLEAARIMNDDMTAARVAYPGRIEWFASLPWQYPELALAELDRAADAGAVGVMVLANIDGQPLTDPAFESIWSAIDARALPVLVHPTAPPGVAAMDMQRFQLTASIGFTFDTSLAVARMIYDGFFDRYRALARHRRAWRRRAALPHLAHGPVLRQHSGVPREDLDAAERIHAAHQRRRGGLRTGRARALRRAIRRRQRDVRVGLSAHHRRHARLPATRRRASRCGARQGARHQRQAGVRVVARVR